MSDRGVSSPVGVILILGITIASVMALFAIGGSVLGDTRADAERTQMENSMSGFSSKASLVGLGESGDQRFALGRASEGQVDIREHAGNVSMYVEKPSGERSYIGNVSMGSVVYESDGREIAYQGGGVWTRQNGYSRMVSPPEFHYRSETLTFPILNVTGSGSANGDVRGTVRSEHDSRQLYPNVSKDDDFDNPLTNGTVYIEIETDYCQGWESFFESRSQGRLNETCDEGPTDTVVVDLTVSFDPAFGSAVTAERIENDGANIENTREGIIAPSASSRIEERIQECLDGDCEDEIPDQIDQSDTYYTEDAGDFDGIDIDTSDGPVDIVINDTESGIDGTGNIEITDGDETVSVYVKTDGDISMGGGDDVNEGGDASQFITYVHSDVSAIKMTGSPSYTGGIYAPNTAMDGDQGGGGGCGGGSVSVTGSVVVDSFCFQNGDFNHEESMNDIDLDIDADTVKYLHVSESAVEVDLSS